MSTPVSSENIIPAGNNKVPPNYWVVNLICLWFSQILVLAGFACFYPDHVNKMLLAALALIVAVLIAMRRRLEESK